VEKKRGWPTVRSRLENHLLPALGSMRLAEIRPRHLAHLVQQLSTTELAPRTIRQVYASIRVLFRAAVRAEVLTASPAVLGRDDLPKAADRDPEWRAGAVFSRAELEQLLGDEVIAPHDRVMAGLKGLAGLRNVEVIALRWRQWDPAAEPLGRLAVFRTKTGQPRAIPVHPVLASLLAEWKLSGWQATHGRTPTPDDLIAPRVGQPTVAQTADYALRRHHRALEQLQLRRRRGHDLRRTFITLARADGARRDVLEAITHGSRGNIVDVYTEWPWATLCEAVGCLRVQRKTGQLMVVQLAVGDEFSHTLLTRGEDVEKSAIESVLIEPPELGTNVLLHQSRGGSASRGFARLSEVNHSPRQGNRPGRFEDGEQASDGPKSAVCEKCEKKGRQRRNTAIRQAIRLLDGGDVAGARELLLQVIQPRRIGRPRDVIRSRTTAAE
jgi:integrase